MIARKARVKNYCLDFFKGIACILVVFMHCEFPGRVGIVVQCIARFCVPLFFMTSGYFCYYEDGRTDVALKKVVHIGKLAFYAAVFYIIFAIAEMYLFEKTLEISLQRILEFVFLNEPIIIAGQLWFLFALLYDYIIFAIVEKKKLFKAAYILIPILFFAYIMLAQGAHIMGISVPNIIYRNFLIEGFPLFMLGYWLHENGDKIKLSNTAMSIIIMSSTAMCIVERELLGRDFGVNIVSFFQVIAIFLFAINNPNKFKNSPLRLLGEKYSLYVYILHPAVWHTLEYVYELLEVDKNIIALWVMPILVLVLTILTAWLWNKLKEKYNNPNLRQKEIA